MNLLLSIAALAYSVVVGIRGWLYDRRILSSYRSHLPVISVGNITAGGNGKTPLCLAIANEFRKRGYSPAILSRGYGGRIRGPHQVSRADTPRDVGDEPVLMFEAGFPVFIARARVAGIRLIESLNNVDLVILDDGFQHRALARDVDVVSIFAGSASAISQFTEGKLLPVGMFRENRDAALRRASLVVFSFRSVINLDSLPEIDRGLMAVMPDKKMPIFSSFLISENVQRIVDGSILAPTKICALAAIANPEGFFDSLERLGFDILGRYSFPDHHEFTEEQLSSILAENPGIDFICTTKDSVKIRSMSRNISERFAILPVLAQIVPNDYFYSYIEGIVVERMKAESKVGV